MPRVGTCSSQLSTLGGPGSSWGIQGQVLPLATLDMFQPPDQSPDLGTLTSTCCCTLCCLLTQLCVQAAAEQWGAPTAWGMLDSKRVNGCLTVQESFQHPASSSELSCSLTFEANGSISVKVSSFV